jgi:nucleoside-diphosphate-sugar epimerase
MQRVLVTGGAGFIGSNLIDRLIEQKVQVIILDDLSTGNQENINSKAIFHKVDISDTSKLRTGWLTTIMQGVDTVFHLAAMARVQPSIEEPVPFHNVNVTGTHNLLVAARDAGVKRFVFSSSSSVYGDASIPTSETHNLNPISPYALHKLIGEQYCKLFSTLYDIDTVSLRYFNVYGNRMNLEGAYRLAIPIFAKQILESKPLTINNDGEQRRDFTYVEDVVNANILAAKCDKKLKGEVFNIGNGNNYSVNELADMLGGEKSYGNKVTEPFETLADNTKAHQVLGWLPKGDLMKWIKEYKKEIGI